MINTDRIVPVQKIDLISLYGLILKQNNSTLASVEATGTGTFEIASASTPLITNEPIISCNFASDVTSATIYFVPDFAFHGFTVNGASVTASGEIEADGMTLYKAVLSSGAITVTKVGF